VPIERAVLAGPGLCEDDLRLQGIKDLKPLKGSPLGFGSTLRLEETLVGARLAVVLPPDSLLLLAGEAAGLPRPGFWVVLVCLRAMKASYPKIHRVSVV
jgi:hypothetical protein